MDAATGAPSWITLLIQVPLVGVFIWYSLEMNKRSTESQKTFLDALDKRDQSFEIRNKAVIEAIGSLNAAICAQLKDLERAEDEHDRFVRDNLGKLPVRAKTK